MAECKSQFDRFPWKAVLLDFDQAIADTLHLRHLRDACRWTEYLAQIVEAPPLLDSEGVIAARVVAWLKQANVPTAIVTNGPDNAVRAWLEAHSIRPPAILGFHQVPETKPGCGRLTEALKLLGYAGDRNQVLSIGDLSTDHYAARRAGIKAGSFSSRVPLRQQPDYYFPSALDLNPVSSVSPAGHFFEEGGRGILTHSFGARHTLLVAGQYIPRNRRGTNKLSEQILEWKQRWASAESDYDGCPEVLRTLSLEMIRRAMDRSLQEVVVSWIPPHGGCRDRVGTLLRDVCAEIGVRLKETLRWSHDPGPKHGSQKDRDLRDSLSPILSESPISVVLFDDIRTMGRTLEAAEAALASGGCQELTSVVWGQTEYIAKNDSFIGRISPLCHEETSPMLTAFRDQIRETHQRAYEPWSTNEDDQLAMLVSDGQSIQSMAKLLERTPGAIRSRCRRLGLEFS